MNTYNYVLVLVMYVLNREKIRLKYFLWNIYANVLSIIKINFPLPLFSCVHIDEGVVM